MQTTQTNFAERINPRHFNFSPKLVAVVGGILGHDYGVRDGRGGLLGAFYITSDGYAIASSTAHETGAFLGHASDVERNLAAWKAELLDEDAVEFDRIYATRVTDWRTQEVR